MTEHEYCAPEQTLGTAIRTSYPNENIRTVLTREITNLPIRVPSTDWAAVATGRKRMFRTYNRSQRFREAPVVSPELDCPRPCLLFAGRGHPRRWAAVPGVLLSHRVEPLGAITPEDLLKEGHHFLPGFRFYWRQRYQSLGWRPWEKVSVLEVRPWQPEDREEFGDWAITTLLGEWFDDSNPRHDP